MTAIHDMQHAVARLIEALDSDDADIIPLAANVVHSSPLLPDPIEGESAVRAHIAAIAPFVSRVELKRALYDGDSAALVIEFESVNGVKERTVVSYAGRKCGEVRELRILKPEEMVPLAPASMVPMGRYAYKIVWSDGHDTGIYTLEYLRELGEPL